MPAPVGLVAANCDGVTTRTLGAGTVPPSGATARVGEWDERIRSGSTAPKGLSVLVRPTVPVGSRGARHSADGARASTRRERRRPATRGRRGWSAVPPPLQRLGAGQERGARGQDLDVLVRLRLRQMSCASTRRSRAPAGKGLAVLEADLDGHFLEEGISGASPHRTTRCTGSGRCTGRGWSSAARPGPRSGSPKSPLASDRPGAGGRLTPASPRGCGQDLRRRTGLVHRRVAVAGPEGTDGRLSPT